MSAERSLEAWEEVQRQGQDLADRLAHGFTGLIQSHMAPPSFSWPGPQSAKLFDLEFPSQNFVKPDFKLATDTFNHTGITDGVSAIFDIGNKLGQVGVDLGNGFNGFLQQFFRGLPVPFRQDESAMVSIPVDLGARRDKNSMGVSLLEDVGAMRERLHDFGFVGSDGGVEGSGTEEVAGFNLRAAGQLGRPEGVVNISSTYDSRTHNVESSLNARGDLWRVEASQGSSTSGSDTSSLYLVQLGPILFVRESILLPVHLSKQHLLWYGYDRKNGMHSLCPAVWSKHRRWLLMSMLCLNPVACSFVDLQFPNGQLTYVSGEGLTTSAFVPVFGGLLQAEGQYPGEMRYSFSYKNKWGTRITPMVQWPDKSFSLGLQQSLAWQRFGVMLRPKLQLSVRPTIGGSNPGVHAELIHSVKEQLNLIYGCAFTTHPTAFASASIGRSKWNGNVGSSGLVVRLDTPLSNNVGRPSFSVQINSGIEF